MNTITAELAYRLRHDRGLILPTNGNYSNPRLKEIALREFQLFDELEKLDKELEFLKLFEKDYGNQKEGNTGTSPSVVETP